MAEPSNFCPIIFKSVDPTATIYVSAWHISAGIGMCNGVIASNSLFVRRYRKRSEALRIR